MRANNQFALPSIFGNDNLNPYPPYFPTELIYLELISNKMPHKWCVYQNLAKEYDIDEDFSIEGREQRRNRTYIPYRGTWDREPVNNRGMGREDWRRWAKYYRYYFVNCF